MKKYVYIKELLRGLGFFEFVSISAILLNDKLLLWNGINFSLMPINIVDYWNISLKTLSLFFSLFLGILFFKNRRVRLFKSERTTEIDILSLLGILFGMLFYNETMSFIRSTIIYTYIINFDTYKLLYLFLIGVSIFAIYFFTNKRKKLPDIPLFIPDKAIEDSENDFLFFSDKAKKLAEKIYDNGIKNSLVYGINAPWGTGKSSFVNLCIKWLSEKNDVIIYKFEPLMYESKNNLVTKYVDGLIECIDSAIYAPELVLLLSKYRKFFSDNHGKVNFTSFNINALLPFDNQKKIFNSIKQSLKELNMQIIIVVDDLDRLEIQSIKDILYVIKKSFYFDNISYILCYDNANIGKTFAKKHNLFSKENKYHINYLLGQEEIVNFMEKFVNIRYNIILDSVDLLGYLKKQKENSPILFLNPKIYSQLEKSLENIFKSNDFHEYIPLIGSVRKIKNLINMLILLNFSSIDFEKIDINFDDLIHLLLIYIYYPHIFEKIVLTETAGKHGFFSGKIDNDKFTKSPTYADYVETLTNAQQFLLNQIFGENIKLLYITDFGLKIFVNACINDANTDSKGNLEKHLLLITKQEVPQEINEYKPYVEQLNNFKNSSINISEFFATNHLDKQKLWIGLINTHYTREQKNLIEQSIDFALTELYKYPINKDRVKELSQESIVFYIASLLDKCVIGPTSPSEFSLPVNIQEISNRIFGKKEFDKKGILARIVDYENNILVLNNLLNFRYYIAANNRLSFYNITESLIKTADKNGKIEGDTRDIERNELREISQWIFQYFKDNIRSKNVFEIIENSDTIKDKSIKKELRIFMVYKFISCSNNDSSTIPCGFYDVSGTTDGHGIMRELNNYFFEDCFDLDKDINNKKYFWIFIVDVITYKLYSIMRYNINNITIDPNIIKLIENIVHIQALRLYWEKNAPQLRDYKFISNEVDFYYFGIQALQEYNIIEKISNMLDEYCLAQKN